MLCMLCMLRTAIGTCVQTRMQYLQQRSAVWATASASAGIGQAMPFGRTDRHARASWRRLEQIRSVSPLALRHTGAVSGVGTAMLALAPLDSWRPAGHAAAATRRRV
jgi:hypothetical protein